ncbi:sugar ABC transporter ATP-binding protein [Microbacterium sp. MPKO10]|uniref:sugar ABC transporter ATP-binding protein n=1 Tax=Microbacterium sp. MPKO10 TaxID=2989818 RepID=UPI002236C021|nr:sugar ABC transporter ATP-binding protein [Microbacterium sp. MPKO10]MCW4457726.1 sugar ABC transporter ATP-binding protein [Microbacterium sp. MPKO10]
MPPTDVDAASQPAMLACENIKMSFGGIPVLKGVDLSLEPGTVTALAGENGAGKSTLMKIASGQYRPDAGTVYVRDRQLPMGNLKASNRLGIAIVPQELASIPELTVYENLYIGRETRTPLGTLNRRAMIGEATVKLREFGVDIDPAVQMGSLPVGMRQIIEIVKATSRGARVLLLDEPTSAIAEREVAHLYDVVRNLRDQGVAVLFTTHKMEEMRAMADRVVVLRDGQLITDSALADITDDDIVTAMIGRELENLFPEIPRHKDDVVLEATDLVIAPEAEPISFRVRRGEILGLAGLVGAGRTELIECIYGIRTPVSGTITVSGNVLKPGQPQASIERHIAIVPEDRKGAGAIMPLSVIDNATLPRLDIFSKFGVITRRKRQAAIGEAMRSMRLKSDGLGQAIENLSGGNQQKVVLGRWLTATVDALLLDEPTRGVDVGARSEIYRIITELAEEGMAVVMASSDMPEILSLTHRALVMREFSVAGELNREQLTSPDAQDTIFRLASGLETSHPTHTEELAP